MASYGEWRWTERLARRLADVADKQLHHWQQLDERRSRREGRQSDAPSPSAISDPSYDLRSFYREVCWREGTYFDERYARLRKTLQEARDVVGEHPAIAAIGRVDDRLNEFHALFLNHPLSTSRLDMVAGLMCRAREVGKDGFEIAACELEALLDLSLDNEVDPVLGDLDVGYHVSIFYGLQMNERLDLSDDVTVVPFDQTAGFVERNVLLRVAPSVGISSDWTSLGAIVKRFRWKPVLWSPDDAQPAIDWDVPPFGNATPFFENVRDFIELLAVKHGGAVVSLMEIDLCTDRRASLLFGQPHYHTGAGWKSWATLPGWPVKPRPLGGDAIEQAGRLCWGANPNWHRGYAPVISRLAQALARSGR